MSEQRLRDVVEIAASADDIAAHLRAIGTTIADSAQWIEENHSRDERNLVLYKLLLAPLPYIDLYAENLSGPVSLLAFCTRTVFELNVRVRHVLLLADNWKSWVAEAADDRAEMFEAIIGLAEPNDPRIEQLRTELNHIKGLKLKHKLPNVRKADTHVATLARKVGLEQEHKSLFKIFSKLVHPTAYLVNSGNALTDTQMKDVLLAHFQLYTLDLLKRVTDELGVPEGVTSGRRYKATGGPSPEKNPVE